MFFMVAWISWSYVLADSTAVLFVACIFSKSFTFPELSGCNPPTLNASCWLVLSSLTVCHFLLPSACYTSCRYDASSLTIPGFLSFAVFITQVVIYSSQLSAASISSYLILEFTNSSLRDNVLDYLLLKVLDHVTIKSKNRNIGEF